MFNTLPANPFPPSSEQMGAGGGGGSYVLPVASADTLGGVKVGNNLSIADGVLSAPAPYSLPTASADTLGGVKVGDNLSIEDGALSALAPYTPPSYSTSEVDTGTKWIDEKDIYFKVITFTNLNITGGSDTSIGAFTDNFIKANGNITEDGTTYSIPDISIRVKVTNDTLCLSSPQGSSWSNTSGAIIVYYTKTESEVN